MSFKLPILPYSYNALEPHIDAKTMEIHYSKHHAGYTTKLNAAIDNSTEEGKTIEDIISANNLSPAIRNNGGGFYNHTLFWEIMTPNLDTKPSGELAEAIDNSFGSFEKFKTAFSNAAATQFGSGWAWLCICNDKTCSTELCICATANQDNPLMTGVACNGTPILCLDVWEHAYYLNYQNRRPDYIEAFFRVINWNKVSENYNSLK